VLLTPSPSRRRRSSPSRRTLARRRRARPVPVVHRVGTGLVPTALPARIAWLRPRPRRCGLRGWSVLRCLPVVCWSCGPACGLPQRT